MPVLQKNRQKNINPARMIVVSFLSVIFASTLILCMPFCARNGSFTPLDVSLFTAMSATCVAGLTLVDTYSYWNYFGQGVILAMVQLGGIGLITFVSFFNFAVGKKLGLRRMQLASESVSLKSNFSDVRQLLKCIFQISLVIELAGTLLLLPAFLPRYGASGIFTALFISISAFCNSGFDVLGRETPFVGLTEYASNPYVLTVIMLLIICGGLGFMVWYDLLEYRKTRHLELQTKIVLIASAVLILSGALLVGVLEWGNSATFGGLGAGDKILNSFFLSVTSRTAGFNTVDIGALNPLTKIILIILMYIGASPCSTGGGIKITTVVVMMMTVVCVFRNKQDTVILGRRIPKETVYRALSLVIVTFTLCFISSILVYYTSCNGTELTGVDAIFETVSAFSTTGFSTGVTTQLSTLARVWLAAVIFIGRVGPISFVLSIADAAENSKNAVVPEGKIIVG